MAILNTLKNGNTNNRQPRNRSTKLEDMREDAKTYALREVNCTAHILEHYGVKFDKKEMFTVLAKRKYDLIKNARVREYNEIAKGIEW